MGMRTMKSPRERGAGKLKAIVWTALLVYIAYLLFQAAPPLMDKYELEDTMRTEARFGAVNKKDVDEIRESVWKKIKDLEMDKKVGIRRDEIRVEYQGRSISIELKYVIKINLLFKDYDLALNASAGDRAL